MAKIDFADKWAASTGDTITATAFFNDPGDGLQVEFENRDSLSSVGGVISGLAGSISTTNIAVAAGEGYGTGKKYAGGENCAFSVASSAGTYYVYWDASAEALAKSTSVPDTSIDIMICKAYWNGTDTLSALVDMRAWGIIPLPLLSCCWQIGTVSTGKKGGFTVPPNTSLWIDAIAMTQADNGSASSTVVDVHVGASASAPVTIFTTQANRASVDNAVTNWTVTYSGIPDTRLLSAGDNCYVEVDQIGDSAQDLIITIYGRYLGA